MLILMILVVFAVPVGLMVSLFFGWKAWRDEPAPDEPPNSEQAASARRARMTIAAIVVALAVASITYRLLFLHRLDQTAALFVGIPTLLAIAVVFAPSPRSATGVACKAVTIALLLSLIFLWEGVLCVVMSAPLFYAVAIAVGTLADRARERRSRAQSTLSCIGVLALLPLCLEGVTDATSSIATNGWPERKSFRRPPIS